MEQFIFPAVFYRDSEEDIFVVAFDDVNLFCNGKTVEECFILAKKLLRDFVIVSYKLNGRVEERPRSYLESAKLHKGKIVLLICAEVNTGRIKIKDKATVIREALSGKIDDDE